MTCLKLHAKGRVGKCFHNNTFRPEIIVLACDEVLQSFGRLTHDDGASSPDRVRMQRTGSKQLLAPPHSGFRCIPHQWPRLVAVVTGLLIGFDNLGSHNAILGLSSDSRQRSRHSETT